MSEDPYNDRYEAGHHNVGACGACGEVAEEADLTEAWCSIGPLCPLCAEPHIDSCDECAIGLAKENAETEA